MLKAVAIDDEPMALEVIKSLSQKIPFLDLQACFTNAFEAINHLKTADINLIFLDIKMPDISGLDLLRSLPHPPMVIFTTAYSEHAVQSFELDAIDYLLKPFSAARFLKACSKAYELFTLKENNKRQVAAQGHLFIKSGYGQIRVELGEILYVQSTGNYMQFVLPEEKILSRLTMHEVEEILPATAFIRIHRSYIIATAKIQRIEKGSVWIRDKEIPIGAGYAHEIEKITGG